MSGSKYQRINKSGICGLKVRCWLTLAKRLNKRGQPSDRLRTQIVSAVHTQYHSINAQIFFDFMNMWTMQHVTYCSAGQLNHSSIIFHPDKILARMQSYCNKETTRSRHFLAKSASSAFRLWISQEQSWHTALTATSSLGDTCQNDDHGIGIICRHGVNMIQNHWCRYVMCECVACHYCNQKSRQGRVWRIQDSSSSKPSRS